MGGQSTLSVINKPRRWSGERPILDKQAKGHCLRISTPVGRRPEETLGGVSENVCVFLVCVWGWGGDEDVI